MIEVELQGKTCINMRQVLLVLSVTILVLFSSKGFAQKANAFGLKIGVEKPFITSSTEHLKYANELGFNVGFAWYRYQSEKVFFNFNSSIHYYNAKIHEVTIGSHLPPISENSFAGSAELLFAYVLAGDLALVSGYSFLYNSEYTKMWYAKENHSIPVGLDYKIDNNHLAFKYYLPLQKNEFDLYWTGNPDRIYETTRFHRIELSYVITF